MPIAYTRLEDGGVSIIFPSPGHDGWKDVPDGAVGAKAIAIEDMPQEYPEFRDAWKFDGERINICLQTAAKLALNEMKRQQDVVLEQLGRTAMHALMNDDQPEYQALRAQYKAVKDAHKPLEDLKVSGYNDPAALDKIKELATLPQIRG